MTATLLIAREVPFAEFTGKGRVGRKGSYGPMTSLRGQVDQALPSKLAARGCHDTKIAEGRDFLEGVLRDTSLEDPWLRDAESIAELAADRLARGFVTEAELAQMGREPRCLR